MDTRQPVHVYRLEESRPQAIVVYCGDPRFLRAIREFMGNELHLQDGEYFPIVVSGSVATLSEPVKLPGEFKFMKERIELILKIFGSIRRVILINHEDCRHYEAMKNSLGDSFLRDFKHMTERQVRDLKQVANFVLGLGAPGLRVEMYYARIVNNGGANVQFDRI